MRILLLAACLLAGACAPQEATQAQDSLLPGTIGVLVRNHAGGVVVAAVRPGAEGVRAGDVVVRYNDTPVGSAREFNRLVVDSPPGSVAELELVRAGVTHRVQLPVRQLDTMPRG